MVLYVVRHGVPVDPSDWEEGEGTRPLTPAGEAEVAATMAALRDRHGLAVDRIYTSPLTRARRTAEIAGEVLGAPVEAMAHLASGASPAQILGALERKAGRPERVMIVGHNPDLPMLIGSLTGESSLAHSLDRCGVTKLEGELAPGRMRVAWRKAPNALD